MRARLGSLLAMLAAGCASTEPEPPPPPPDGQFADAIFAITPLPRTTPAPTTADWVNAMRLVQGAGARGVMMTYTWRELEPEPRRLALDAFRSGMEYAVSERMRAVLGIQLINTVTREVPGDLQRVAFDAPEFRARFLALLDAIAPTVRGRVLGVTVGNEVDGYLIPTDEWGAFTRFLDAIRPEIKARLGNDVLVGTTLMLPGTRTHRPQARALLAVSDAFFVTSYATGDRFRILAPSAARAALREMVTFADGKPVIVQEFGAPADPLLASSGTAQGAVLAAALDEWRAIGSTRMPFFSIFLLHDLPASECDRLTAYYGLPNVPEFRAFLCSLGLRAADGTPRASWDSVLAATRRIGLR